MKKTILIFSVLILATSCSEEKLTGEHLIDKAIAYHDPVNAWDSFNNKLSVIMETPDNADRVSDIIINRPDSYFFLRAEQDTTSMTFEVKKEECQLTLNGKTNFTNEEAETHRLTCDRAKLYRNYYSYLYGLPMKLKDPGTLISPEVIIKEFNQKTYNVVEVKYDAVVGTDVWYFYFDPETFAMEVYQFFKTDENGDLKQDSGEYILLSELKTVNDIKMPKIRKWYYNKDDKFLGTDILQ